MRTRRPLRPALESLTSRIAPSSLFPYENPILAPVIIKDAPPPSVDPLAPVLISADPCSVPFVGDGAAPPAGQPAPLFT